MHYIDTSLGDQLEDYKVTIFGNFIVHVERHMKDNNKGRMIKTDKTHKPFFIDPALHSGKKYTFMNITK